MDPLPSASKSPPPVLQYENTDHASDDRQRQMTAKGKAKEGDMRSDHRQHHKYADPCVPVNSVSQHCSHRGGCQHEVEAADAHGAALDAAQSRFLEQRHDVARIDVTMTVEMRKEA